MTIRNLTSWLLAIILFLSFLPSGLPKIVPGSQMVNRFADWGYPVWFITVIGTLEIAGALLIVIPKLASYGAILITILMAGAAYTHLASGIGSPTFALGYMVLALLLAWLRYPLAFKP